MTAVTAIRGAFASKLSKSSDDLAFIGTISLETRKQIGMRTSLSLWTDYEYISSVPKMHYADFNRPTRIDDDGVLRQPHHAAAEYRLRLRAALRRAAEIACRSELPQSHRLDRMVGALAQDEIRALPGRQDVLFQIDQIDRAPDR